MLNEQAGKNFCFNVPLELVKSDEKGWYVKGLASTEDKDLQGEIVRQNGLDISELTNGRGMFNYEHKNDPENLVGLIEDAKVNKSGLLVEGYLFKEHKRAQAIAQIMQSLHKDNQKRVQLSIEGTVQERANGGKDIKKAKINRVAVTFEPVNQKTYLSFMKSLSANEEVKVENSNVEEVVKAEEPKQAENVETVIKGNDPKEIGITPELDEELKSIEKTMTAGYGAESPPAQRTGGAALQPESIDSKTKKINEVDEEEEKKKKKKVKMSYKSKKLAFKKALLSAFMEFPHVPASILAKSVYEIINERIE